ncbi:hypothetical protein OUZ56_014998 [Daphnia magna]|uniref:Secreted protein n=1 Tax=Daphnia magna TaxID=35525 RepID=A0ABR0ALI3_9CRUS|nr:hypothetical protein OUZ56_014998 [Daphnia magna]
MEIFWSLSRLAFIGRWFFVCCSRPFGFIGHGQWCKVIPFASDVSSLSLYKLRKIIRVASDISLSNLRLSKCLDEASTSAFDCCHFAPDVKETSLKPDVYYCYFLPFVASFVTVK